MEILEKVNLLLDITGKDAVITMLIDDAKTEVIEHCKLTAYIAKFDAIVVKMVIQNYNKSRVQGINSESFSGVSESYINGYTADVMAFLNRNRKVRFI